MRTTIATCLVLTGWILAGCDEGASSGEEANEASNTDDGGGGDGGGGAGTGDDNTDGGGTGTGGGDGVVVKECLTPFSACGGDPTGDWEVHGICDPGLDLDELDCGEASYEVTADRSSGVITLTAAGTYDRTYNIDLDYDLVVPKSCLFGQGCNMLETFAGDMVDSCTDTGDDCDCVGSFQTTDIASGTWMMDGDVLVTDGSDRTAICINGNLADSEDEEDGSRLIWTR